MALNFNFGSHFENYTAEKQQNIEDGVNAIADSMLGFRDSVITQGFHTVNENLSNIHTLLKTNFTSITSSQSTFNELQEKQLKLLSNIGASLGLSEFDYIEFRRQGAQLNVLQNIHELLKSQVGGGDGGGNRFDEAEAIGSQGLNKEAIKLFGRSLKRIVSALRDLEKIDRKTVDNFVLAINKLTGAFQKLERYEKVIYDTARTINKLRNSILTLGIALVAALPLYAIGIFGAIAFASTLTILGSTLFFFGQDYIVENIERATDQFVPISIASLVLGGALAVFSNFVSLEGVLLFSTSIIVTGTAMALAGRFSGSIIRGSLAITTVGISVASFALGMGLWSATTSGLTYDQIFKLGTSVAIVGASVALVGVVSGFVIAGSAALTVMGIGLISFAFGASMSMKMLGEDFNAKPLSNAIFSLIQPLTVVGLLSPMLFLASGVLTTLGISLTLFAVGLNVLSTVDAEKVEQSSKAIDSMIQPLIKVGLHAPILLLSSVALTATGIGLIVFATGMNVAASLAPDDTENIRTSITDMIEPMVKLGVAAPLVFLGSIVLLTVGITIPIFAIGLKFASMIEPEMSDKVKKSIKDTSNSLIMTGLKSPLILLGSAALIVASASIMVLTVGMLMASSVPDRMFKAEFGPNKDQTPIEAMIGSVTNAFTSQSMFSLIEAGLKAATFLPVTASLIALATGLKIFESVIDIDGEKVNAIISSVVRSFAGLDGESIETGVEAVQGLGQEVANIAKGVKKFKEMKLSPEESEAISNNIQNIVSVLAKTFGEIGRQREKTMFGFTYDVKTVDGKSYTAEDVKRGIEATRGMGDILVNTAKGITAFAKLDAIPDGQGGTISFNRKRISRNISTILGTIASVFGEQGKKSSSYTFEIFGFEAFSLTLPSETPEGYTAEDIKKGIESFKGSGELLINLAKGITSFAKLDAMPDGQGGTMKVNMNKVKSNMKSIITGLGDILGSIGSEDGGFFSSGKTGDIQSAVEALQGVGPLIRNIGEGAAGFSKVENPEKLPNNLRNFLNALLGVNINENRISGFKDITSNLMEILDGNKISGAASGFGTLADDASRFTTSINKLDVQKIDKVNDLLTLLKTVGEQDKQNQLLGNISNVLEDGVNNLIEIVKKIANLQAEGVNRATETAQAINQQNVGTPAGGTTDLTPLIEELKQINGLSDEMVGALNQIKSQLSAGITVETENQNF